MLPEIKSITPKSREYPPSLREKKNRDLFPQIRTLGDLSLLHRPLLGLFCSVKCPGDLILRTYDLARALRDAGVPVISGFHSPIEKDCLDLLLRGSQPVVICPARSIEKMRLGESLKEGVEKGRVLVLSPFEQNVKRPTAETSQRRNRFVGALATTAFVAYAQPGGMVEAMCREIVSQAQTFFTFASRHTENLATLGATCVVPDRLQEWAASAGRMLDESNERSRL
jgi:predicted Rossmann fold nucleotide-binding protein DprA/Smf involved in DNA uptake